MNSKVYKWCAVPQCKNTSIKTPKKVFVYVPNKKIIRDKWLTLARRNPNDVVTNSPLYFCEDHFDLPNDMENYMEYHVMGSVSQVRMKPRCMPKKFICQPDRNTQISDTTERPYIAKKQRKMVLEEFEKQLKEKRTSGAKSATVDQASRLLSKSPAKSVNKAIKGSGSLSKDAADDLENWSKEHSDEEIDISLDINEHDRASFISPAHIVYELDHEMQTFVINEDKESDRLLQDLLPDDSLKFDWSCDHRTYTGQRETFTGQAGPTFEITDETRPIDIFLKFFDSELLDLMTRQTNKYATAQKNQPLVEHSRLNFYKNVDREEMAIFISIIILQGLIPMPVEKNYWVDNGYLTLRGFKDLMTYNRFVLLKRLLYFSDTSLDDEDMVQFTPNEIKLRKIRPVLDLLNDKFSSLYLPSQNICIDESLLKWQGRLSFTEKIATRAAEVGVKSCELFESATGYLWTFSVYTGKNYKQLKTDNMDARTTDERTPTPTDKDGTPLPATATATIVYDLVKPLFNLGHTVVMDHFYNSPLLARYLKAQGTDCCGPLRVNREFLPEAVKSLSKYDLCSGEIVQSYTHDLYVMTWRDTDIVSMLSTYHKWSIDGKEKNDQYKYKPEVVLDYNRAMGGVNKKNQLLSAFPIESVHNQAWYKKVFRRLLNCTLLNCYVIYKTRHTHVAQWWFRNQLAEELVKTFKPPSIQRPMTVITSKYIMGPQKNSIRPILQGNHFLGVANSKYPKCVWCKKSRSKYFCKQCEVPLCLLICFEEYHTVPES